MKNKRIVFTLAHVDLIVEEYEEYVYLNSIVVHDNHQNKGYGTQALCEVIKHAEKVEKPLLAWVSNELGGQLDSLIKWYKKYGFYEEYNIINADYNYNFRKDYRMKLKLEE